jgi:flagellar hook-basal body complex protein FliE
MAISSIGPTNIQTAIQTAIQSTPPLGRATSSTIAKATEAEFGQAFQKALKAVSQTQAESSRQQQSLQFEKDGASIEGTMLAMQKSQVAFTAAVTVRNKMVSAYSEIMGMQV